MTEVVENEEEIEMWKIRKVRAVVLAPHPRASVKKQGNRAGDSSSPRPSPLSLSISPPRASFARR